MITVIMFIDIYKDIFLICVRKARCRVRTQVTQAPPRQPQFYIYVKMSLLLISVVPIDV